MDTANGARASSASGACAAPCPPPTGSKSPSRAAFDDAPSTRLVRCPCRRLLLAGCDYIDDPVIPLTIAYRGEQSPPAFDRHDAVPSTCSSKTSRPTNAATARPLENSPHNLRRDHRCLSTCSPSMPGPWPPSRNAPFDTDWTNEESNSYWDQLAFQVNPIGRVNRRGGPSEIVAPNIGPAVDDRAWPDPAAHLARRRHPRPHSCRRLHLHTHVTFAEALQVKFASPCSSSRTTSSPPNWTTAATPRSSPTFEHNHMLRGSLSGADGLVIATDPTAGSTVQMDYTMAWPSEWVQENCHVLAVLTNAARRGAQLHRHPLGPMRHCAAPPWSACTDGPSGFGSSSPSPAF